MDEAATAKAQQVILNCSAAGRLWHGKWALLLEVVGVMWCVVSMYSSSLKAPAVPECAVHSCIVFFWHKKGIAS
jgi:hypothetical protein